MSSALQSVGTFLIECDSKHRKGISVTQDVYEGECFYFQNGRIGIKIGYQDTDNNLVAGYCCDGNISQEASAGGTGDCWWSR